MKSSSLDILILNTIKLYHNNINNKNIKIITNTNDEINILFDKDFLIKYLKLDYFKKESDDIKNIIENISKDKINELSIEEKNNIKNRCTKLNVISNISLNNIHSVIQMDGITYLILESINTKSVLELCKIDGYYVINNVYNTKFINKLINSKKSFISFPTRTILKENDNVVHNMHLSKTDKKERLLELKELIYLDLKDNVRDNHHMIKYKELFMRVPIIKK